MVLMFNDVARRGMKRYSGEGPRAEFSGQKEQNSLVPCSL
jgi:hypothetical protein